MNLPKTFARMLFVMILLVLSSGGGQVLAQATADASQQTTQAEKKDDETNLDTQLYLLVATNQDIDDAKMPASLESVIRQLRASLPFKNYRLTATLINRVRNEGRFSLRWVVGPMTASGAAASGTLTPSFHEFRVNGVKLVQDARGQQLVRIDGFTFGARIPIQTGMAAAYNAPASPIINAGPIINYESTGLNTDISMREGEAVIVGTLNVGPSGDAIILVMSARRTSK
jgi:hypothetical protein